MRVVLGMLRERHFDPRQLFAGGAVLVHVALRGKGVHPERAAAIDQLKRRLGAGVDRSGLLLTTRTVRQRHQGDRALASRDGRRRVADLIHRRGAADHRPVEIRQLVEAEILGHRHRHHADATGAEEAVDVVQLQPRVGERPGRNLRVYLGRRPIRDDTIRVLVRTDDKCFALDTHFTPAAIFTGMSVRPWISSAEKPSATSSMTKSPSTRRRIARSVTTTSTQATPVIGYEVRCTSFGRSWLSRCSIMTMSVCLPATRSMAPPIPPSRGSPRL